MTETEPNVLIHHLTPRNFLSFGPENTGINLMSLNVLIGPNGSGKSNLIEAINFMRAAPREFSDVTRKGGGVMEWIWKGLPKETASVDLVMAHPTSENQIRHVVEFQAEAQRFKLVDERVEEAEQLPWGGEVMYFYHGLKEGEPVAMTDTGAERVLSKVLMQSDSSIVAQLIDPSTFTELTWLARSYEKVRIYREWAFGRSAVFREPQQADMRNDTLSEDFSNLGLFLSKLRKTPKAKNAIIENLKKLYDGLTDFDVHIEGGTVQVFFTEGDFVIPATRLSDGTLRFLCLLAILCDPDPPPLICIEEPELGLHPDILPTVADLLKSAAERTQLIVTTHSDILVDAMTETPECVVVCEKHDGKTEMNRLSADELKVWLEKYRLGQLWIKGQIGGTRW